MPDGGRTRNTWNWDLKVTKWFNDLYKQKYGQDMYFEPASAAQGMFVIWEALEAAGKKPGDIIVGGIDMSPATVDGIIKGYISASFDQVLYLQGYYPVQQCFLTKNYKIPGLSIDTGVNTFTPKNYQDLKPLIDQGIR